MRRRHVAYFPRISPIAAANHCQIGLKTTNKGRNGPERMETMEPKVLNGRFVASIVEAARTETTQMPWARGARRAQMIARRTRRAALARVQEG